MAEHKSPQELAAEITIAALSTAPHSQINDKELVAKFYRAIFKEISYCLSKPADELELD